MQRADAADEQAGGEQGRECRMQVRVAEGQPSGGLGALLGAAVSSQSSLRVGVGDIAHDRGVLGQDEVAIDDHRHRAGRVEGEEGGFLDLLLGDHFDFEGLAGPLQCDVVGGRARAGFAVELHGSFLMRGCHFGGDFANSR